MAALNYNNVEVGSLQKMEGPQLYTSLRINVDELDSKVKMFLWKELFTCQDVLLLQFITLYTFMIQIIIFYTVRELAGLTVVLVPFILSILICLYYLYRYWWIYKKRPYVDIEMGCFIVRYHTDTEKKIITPSIEPCIIELYENGIRKEGLVAPGEYLLYSLRSPDEPLATDAHEVIVPIEMINNLRCSNPTQSSTPIPELSPDQPELTESTSDELSEVSEPESNTSSDSDFTFIGGKK